MNLKHLTSYSFIIKSKLHKLLYRIEADRTVFFGILIKIWNVFAQPLTIFLIFKKFTPEYQGYYYTFYSLLAWQIVVELGLGTVIVQFASHEWSKLRIDDSGTITGDKESLSRLVSLANIVFKWYLVSGIIITLGLGFGGYFLFSQLNNPYVNWLLPWFFLCFFTGIAVCFIPLWSLLEGCNQVSAVYTYRFLNGVITSFAVWIAILSGAKLWALSISAIATILYAVLFLKYRYLKFIKTLIFTKPLCSRMDWRKEILPMQWRIALSWISGYFVFYLFTPVIFHYYGPVIAGQFGMTWSIVGMVSMIASPWLYPKVPRFGILIVRKEFTELDSLFVRIMKIFIIITTLAAMTAWLAIYGFNKLGYSLANRLLPVLPSSIFLIAQVVLVLLSPFSAYMRAHKKEPFLFLSIISAILTASSTLILGRYCSITAIGIGYLAINIILIPFVVLIWYRCRREWHMVKLG